ncbi:hypothetical protein AKJ16_DCAP21827 [Drosera capensis]
MSLEFGKGDDGGSSDHNDVGRDDGNDNDDTTSMVVVVVERRGWSGILWCATRNEMNIFKKMIMGLGAMCWDKHASLR